MVQKDDKAIILEPSKKVKIQKHECNIPVVPQMHIKKEHKEQDVTYDTFLLHFPKRKVVIATQQVSFRSYRIIEGRSAVKRHI